MATMEAIAGGLALLGAVAAAALSARTWWRLRGPRVITCPDNQRPAGVDVDMRYTLLTGAVGRPHFRLKDCSRWPEKAGCGQMCLMEVEESPQGCLVRHVLEDWYAGKSCSYCGHPFGAIHWHDHKPGLRASDGRFVEWTEVAPEDVPSVLADHRPVCWNCLVAEGFRRRFPDRVVERPPRPTNGPH
jgi:hypothetical protein